MSRLRFLIVLAAAALAANPALAHHAMGGETPNSFGTGLLSGLAHPVIGLDHLAFVIGVGLAAAFAPNRLLSPLAFVLGTLAGCGLLLADVALPIPELVISASGVLIGAMILSGRSFASALWLALFAVAGLFHGWAYGQSIVGAETTPLLAYLIGFAAVQFAVAVGVMWLTRQVWRAGSPQALQVRLAGAVVAGIAFTFLFENVESLLLPIPA